MLKTLKTSIPPDAFPTDLNEQADRSCALFFFIAQFVLPCSIEFPWSAEIQLGIVNDAAEHVEVVRSQIPARKATQ